MHYIYIRFNKVQCNKYAKTNLLETIMFLYLNFNVIDNILFKLSDRIWDTILFIYLHNNPYIKTHNLLENRQPLYNYMIYTSQLCLDLMIGSS